MNEPEPGESRAAALLAPASCTLDTDGHCITCADEALPGRVVEVDEATALALVVIGAVTTEIDVSLVDAVRPGHWLLVHGGVAISALEEQ